MYRNELKQSVGTVGDGNPNADNTLYEKRAKVALSITLRAWHARRHLKRTGSDAHLHQYPHRTHIRVVCQDSCSPTQRFGKWGRRQSAAACTTASYKHSTHRGNRPLRVATSSLNLHYCTRREEGRTRHPTTADAWLVLTNKSMK